LELAGREIERCRRSGRPITIGYVDLDCFKLVNDTKGHAEGNDVLREVGHTIKQAVRPQDVPARLGGDEFGLVLPETNKDEAAAVFQRLMGSLRLAMQNRNAPVTFSIGVVTFSKPPASVEAMIKRADDLMYRVKKNGKDAIQHELVHELAVA